MKRKNNRLQRITNIQSYQFLKKRLCLVGGQLKHLIDHQLEVDKVNKPPLRVLKI